MVKMLNRYSSFLLLILSLSSTNVLSQSESAGERAGEHSHENDDWKAPTYNGGDFVSQIGASNLANISSKSGFINKDVFIPRLEVNTNRGSLRSSFAIKLPPNLLKMKSLVFKYNHRQSNNIGYGTGWSLGLPHLDLKGKESKTIGHSSIGEFKAVQCNTNSNSLLESGKELALEKNAPKRCFKPALQSFPQYLYEFDQHYILITNGKTHSIFTKDGLQKLSFDAYKNHITFTWNNLVLKRITNSFNSWSLDIQYLKDLGTISILNNKFAKTPKGVNHIKISNTNEKRIINFNYSDSYLSSVKAKGSQKHLFKGSYEFITQKTKEVTTSLKDKHFFVIQEDINKPVQIKKPDENSKENIEIYLDINGDFRQDKIVINSKQYNHSLKKYFDKIEYKTDGSSPSTCKTRPKKKLQRVKAELSKLKVPYSIYWAKVENGNFEYVLDKSLSNIEHELFDLKLEYKKKSSSNCDRIYYYKPTITVRTPYVISTNKNHKDLLWCKNDKREKSEKDYSSAALLFQRIKKSKSLKNYPSNILKISFDQKKQEQIDLVENIETNVLAGVRKWTVQPGPDCNGRAIQLDLNNDGKQELITGNKVISFSANNYYSQSEPDLSKFFTNIKDTKMDKDLSLFPDGNKFKFKVTKGQINTPKGLIISSEKSSKISSKGSSVKLLTNYYSHFSGRYNVQFSSRNNLQVVKKVEKIDSSNLVQNTKKYSYDQVMHDNILGIYLGFANTKEVIMSASTNKEKEISRRFLKDNNIHNFLLDTRARLQGTEIYKRTESDSFGSEIITKKDAKLLDDNRFFFFTSEKITNFFDKTVYRTLKTKNNYILDEDIIEKHEMEVSEVSDLVNDFNDKDSYSIDNSYTALSNGQIRLSKSRKKGFRTSSNKEFFYNEKGLVKHQNIDAASFFYKYDSLGRLTSISNRYGEISALNYDNLIVSPVSVSNKDKNSFYRRSNLFEQINLLELNNKKTELSYNNDFQVSEIKVDGITRFKRFPFIVKNDKLLPQYSFVQDGQDYNVTLNDFGHPLNISMLKNNRIFNVFKHTIKDGKVLKSLHPHFQGDEAFSEDFTYDGLGREVLKVENLKKKTTYKTLFSKDCVKSFKNSILVETKCSDAKERINFIQKFEEQNHLAWNSMNNLTSVNENLSWDTNPANQVTSFNFNDLQIQRDIDHSKNITKYNDKVLQFDKYDRITSGSIGSSNFSLKFEDGDLINETASNSKFSYQQEYKYDKGLLKRVQNKNFSKTLSYNNLDQLNSEIITNNNSSLKLLYGYNNLNELVTINPFIKEIKYNNYSNVSEVFYTNGLKLQVHYKSGTKVIKSISYKNTRNIITQVFKYNEMEQLLSTRFLGKGIDRALNKSYRYNNFKLNYKPQIKRNSSEKIVPCEEYLCSQKTSSEVFDFLYLPARGIIAGKSSSGENFVYINQEEILINGEYTRLIKVGDIPTGVIYRNVFYPAITNFKREVIGLLNPEGSEYIFIRNFELSGSKTLAINPTYGDFASELDKVTVWSFGRLRHNPIANSHKYYWSASRTYSTETAQWTSIDPYVAWSGKKLAATVGNWNPYIYCNDDTVNCVDPSGYFIEGFEQSLQVIGNDTGEDFSKFFKASAQSNAEQAIKAGKTLITATAAAAAASIPVGGNALKLTVQAGKVILPIILSKSAHNPNITRALKVGTIGVAESISDSKFSSGQLSAPKTYKDLGFYIMKRGAREFGKIMKDFYE